MTQTKSCTVFNGQTSKLTTNWRIQWKVTIISKADLPASSSSVELSFSFSLSVILRFNSLVYPLWGYGTIEAFEEPYKLRKMFQFPDASLVFTWVASFTGNNYGTFETMEEKQRSGARLDKEGNILPNHIRKYHFEDEYTYRI